MRQDLSFSGLTAQVGKSEIDTVAALARRVEIASKKTENIFIMQRTKRTKKKSDGQRRGQLDRVNNHAR